jgi:hypothetical protein
VNRKNSSIPTIASAKATVTIKDDCGPVPTAIGNGPIKRTKPPELPPEKTEANIIISIPMKIITKAAMNMVNGIGKAAVTPSFKSMFEAIDTFFEQS